MGIKIEETRCSVKPIVVACFSGSPLPSAATFVPLNNKHYDNHVLPIDTVVL